MALGYSPGPTALDALNAGGQLLRVLSHLSASETVSLVSWERNRTVIKSLLRTGLFL